MPQLYISLSPEQPITYYKLTRVELGDASEVAEAWTFQKKDGTNYTVSRDAHGISCECPDFVFRHKDEQGLCCKHAAALLDPKIKLMQPAR